MGQILQFGHAFKQCIDDLRLAAPTSLQDLETKLEALSTGYDGLTVTLSFDTVSSKLKIAVGLDLVQLIANLPLRLSLLDFASASTVTSLGLDAASLIIDTFRSTPLAVIADGTVNLDVGIDLTPTIGMVTGASTNTLTDSGVSFGAVDSLVGGKVTVTDGSVRQTRKIIANTASTLTVESDWDTVPVVGNTYVIRTLSPFLFDSTNASFGIRAENNLLNFKALLGVLSVDVKAGSFVLDDDGTSGGTGFATYAVGLTGDRALNAAVANTTVALSGQTSGNLPLSLPESLIPAPEPNSDPFIAVARDLTSPSGTITTNLDGTTDTPPWPQLSTLVSGLDLTGNLDGLRVGFNSLFSKLNDLLNKAVFGQQMPFVDTQLAGSVDFVEQIRTKVGDNLAQLTGILTPEKCARRCSMRSGRVG